MKREASDDLMYEDDHLLSSPEAGNGNVHPPLPKTESPSHNDDVVGLGHLILRGILWCLITFIFAAFIMVVFTERMENRSNTTHVLSSLLFLIAVPITHAIGASSYTQWPDVSSVLTRPRFFAFQIGSWICYACSVVIIATVHYSKKSHPVGWLTLGAVCAFSAQVLMVSSLLSFEGPVLKRKRRKGHFNRLLQGRFILLLNNYMNALLVVGSLFLALLLEYDIFQENIHRKTQTFRLCTAFGSMMLFILAIFNTHGLSGALTNHEWHFWQPFAGGASFIAFQMMSWITFCIGIILQSLFILSTVVVEVEMFTGAMGAAGVLCIVAEVLMLVSVMVFDRHEKGYAIVKTLHKLSDGVYVVALANLPLAPTFISVLPYCLVRVHSYVDTLWLFTFHHASMFCVLGVISLAKESYTKHRPTSVLPYILSVSCFILAPYSVTFAFRGDPTFYPSLIFLTTWNLYFVLASFQGTPEVDGSRWYAPYKSHHHHYWATACEKYFNAVLIRDGPPLDPKETYVMGFHPHGILPLTCMWIQFTSQWQVLLPDIFACPLSASVVHHVPIIRDILQWLGVREVSRKSFENALRSGQSVVLVPGGQAEMIESQSGIKQMRLYTRHRGFLRLAMQHGVSVVPILSMKEPEIMDNVRWPSVQRWTVRKFHIPFPHFPYGWAYLPIPRPVPLTIVVGQPIPLKCTADPTEAQLNAVHKQYFDQVSHLYEKYKEESGCADHELILL